MDSDLRNAPAASLRFEQAFSKRSLPNGVSSSSFTSSSTGYKSHSTQSSLSSIASFSDDSLNDLVVGRAKATQDRGTPRPAARSASSSHSDIHQHRSASPMPFTSDDHDTEAEDDISDLPATRDDSSNEPEDLLQYVLSLKKQAEQPSLAKRLASQRSASDTATQSSARDGSSDSLYKTALQMRHARNMSTDSASSNNSDDGLFFQEQSRLRPQANARASSHSVIAQPGLKVVNLSHKSIADLPIDVIQVLAGQVEKLALGYNHLSTLPKSFATLGSTLRYLNVRGNGLSSLPAVLCELPSLEILDVKGNKITKMPKQAGSLISLRVLVLSKNRLRKLPTYLANMLQLRVLKIDHNPIDWPPRDISALPSVDSTKHRGNHALAAESSLRDEEAATMQAWLSQLQSWIKEHPSFERSLPLRQIYDANASSDDEPVPRRPFTRSPNLTLPLSNLKQPSLSSPPLSSSTSHETPKALRRDDPRLLMHGRNASATLDSPTSVPIRPLRTKKSLPELRLGQSRSPSYLAEPSPALPRASPSDLLSPSSVLNSRRLVGDVDKTIEKDSGAYFKRLSMLPTGMVSKTMPNSLVQFVEAIRGILFSLSQIHSAVKQFVVYAAQDRLPTALSKMMSTADASLGALIDALDRFDSMARKRSDSEAGSAVRDLVEACRENLSIFSKMVGVLGIQLKALTSKADLRYTRTLLLMLFGSLGEIALASTCVTSQADEIVKMLGADNANVMLQPPTPSSENPLPDIPLRNPLSQSTGSLPERAASPTGKARRHAGSFSVEDIQIGESMSPSTPSALAPAAMRPRPLAPNLGKLTSMPVSMPYMDLIATLEGLPPTPVGATPPVLANHPQQLSQSSLRAQLFTENSASRQPMPSPLTKQALNGLPSSSIRDGSSSKTSTTTMSSKVVDDEFLAMVGSTTIVAFSVCNLVHEKLATRMEGQHHSHKISSLLELCDRTNEAARNLKNSLDQLTQAYQDSVPTLELQRSVLSESDLFAKSVIQMAQRAKDASSEIQFTKAVREGLSQLARATHNLLAMRSVSSLASL